MSRRDRMQASVRDTRRPGAGRRLSVDRDALLHRYTVALARRWLAGPLACAPGPGRGVASKHAHGSDGGYDTRCAGANAIGATHAE
ncbi:hypothetical protein QF035_002283 [Streptomyces umbrinus]|uniref:Uncharacterized protein n=1 Tax=Streptomyces umbrinus TaxID=67370 RepID=A0ABU0SPQ3_9ACTN|nr:hypothetical protein [Streptomyces umbrinus]